MKKINEKRGKYTYEAKVNISEKHISPETAAEVLSIVLKEKGGLKSESVRTRRNVWKEIRKRETARNKEK